MIQETSKQGLEAIRPELSKRRKMVLDALGTLESANNLMIAKYLGVGVNQVTGRINELRNEYKMVQFSHEALCPYSGKNTMFWKLTSKGLEEFELIGNPKTANLIIRPFQVEELYDKNVYSAQILSSSKPDKFYDVKVIAKWDTENKQYYFQSECTCEGYYFRQTCSHCDRLIEELKKWNEV